MFRKVIWVGNEICDVLAYMNKITQRTECKIRAFGRLRGKCYQLATSKEIFNEIVLLPPPIKTNKQTKINHGI